MYQCTRSKVLLNQEMSESFPCRLGVRQGKCLSPFLFAMYVNELESHLYSGDDGVTISDFKLMLLLYADDLVIFAETPEALQLQIDKLYNYCQKWKLLINTEKSKIVVFRKGTRISQERWFYDETLIPVCSRIPYLDWFSHPMAHIPEPNPHWLIKRIKRFFNFIKYCCARSLWQVDNPNSVLWLWGLGFPHGAGYWTCSFVFL